MIRTIVSVMSVVLLTAVLAEGPSKEFEAMYGEFVQHLEAGDHASSRRVAETFAKSGAFVPFYGLHMAGMIHDQDLLDVAEELATVVCEISRGDTVRVLLHANCGNGRLMQYIAQHARVEQQTYTDSTAEIIAVMPADRVEMLSTFGDDVAVTAC